MASSLIPGQITSPIKTGLLQAPRLLTIEELDDLVSIIPRVRAHSKEMAGVVREAIQTILKEQFSMELISPDAIPILKVSIRDMFYRSLMSPGSPVGITASEAVGQPTTQATLKSFHTTGAAKNVPTGVEVAKELFNASPIRKREIIYMHFKDKDLSYEDILDKRKDIVGTTIANLISDSEFMDMPSTPVDWWYSVYETITGRPIPQARTFLRLKLDMVKLYGYKYTLSDVCAAIERDQGQVIRCVYSPTFLGLVDVYADRTRIFAAMSRVKGIENKRIGMTDDNIETIFLQMLFLPNLSSITVKGIQDITEMIPVSLKVWSSIVQSEVQLTSLEKEQYIRDIQASGLEQKDKDSNIAEVDLNWFIYVDPVKLRMTGIPISKMITLFQESGCTILEVPTDIDVSPWHPATAPSPYFLTKNRFAVKMNPQWIEAHFTPLLPTLRKEQDFDENKFWKKLDKPSGLIQTLVNMEEKEKNDWINQQKLELKTDLKWLQAQNWNDSEKNRWIRQQHLEKKIYPIREDTKRFRAHVYVYAECVGSNYKAALRHSDVDSFRTTCNNPHYALANIGIEAARNTYVLEFYRFISGVGSYINPRHITIIAEFMTVLGVIVAVTSRGVARQNVGPYARASFEQPMNAFKEGMAYGRQEGVRSTSTCIMVGVRGKFGTNGFRTRLNHELLQQADAAAKAFQAQTRKVLSVTGLDNLKSVDVGAEDPFLFENQPLGAETLFQIDLDQKVDLQVAPLSPRATTTVAEVKGPPEVSLLLCPKGPIPVILAELTVGNWLQAILAAIEPAPITADIRVRPASPRGAVASQPGLPTLAILNVPALLTEAGRMDVASTGAVPLDLGQDEWV